jgi:hypothetical protein
VSIPRLRRREVIRRADNRCEYCGLSQAGQEALFHIDHVTPLVSGGPNDFDNLALACVSCSLRKGDRRRASDPVGGQEATLFNPRQQEWKSNFQWKGTRVIGRTAIGRATIELLKMNRPLVLAIRAEERIRGRHPPP